MSDTVTDVGMNAVGYIAFSGSAHFSKCSLRRFDEPPLRLFCCRCFFYRVYEERMHADAFLLCKARGSPLERVGELYRGC